MDSIKSLSLRMCSAHLLCVLQHVFLGKENKEPARLIKMACVDRSVEKSEDFNMKSRAGKDKDEDSEPLFADRTSLSTGKIKPNNTEEKE